MSSISYKVVVCNVNTEKLNLTIGRGYYVLFMKDNEYTLLNDVGLYEKYPVQYFITQESYNRNIIINEILK